MIQRKCAYVVCLLLLVFESAECWSQPVRGQSQASAENAIRRDWPGHEPTRTAVYAAPAIPPRALPAATGELVLQPTNGGKNPIAVTLSSLGVAAGLMFGFIWISRRMRPPGTQMLADGLVEVVGKVALDAKHHAHLVRFGDRLLLLSLQGAAVAKLGEISLPESTLDQSREPVKSFGERTPRGAWTPSHLDRGNS